MFGSVIPGQLFCNHCGKIDCSKPHFITHSRPAVAMQSFGVNINMSVSCIECDHPNYGLHIQPLIIFVCGEFWIVWTGEQYRARWPSFSQTIVRHCRRRPASKDYPAVIAQVPWQRHCCGALTVTMKITAHRASSSMKLYWLFDSGSGVDNNTSSGWQRWHCHNDKKT